MADGRAPRLALFQDLSGLGRCALTVALPVLSVMGAQACPLPTALLSAHTMYEGAAVTPCDGALEAGLAHWRALGARFDGAYSGYLASPAQAKLIASFLREQREAGCKLRAVDPAMADHGRLYRALPPDMPEAMRALCAEATLITPNLTEACLLTGRPYREAPLPAGELTALLRDLLALGPDGALITGAPLPDGRTANALMLRGEAGARLCAYRPLPAAYPGTGDLFASALIGALLTGQAPDEALGRATALCYRAIADTIALKTPAREGVCFEPLLRELTTIAPFPTEWAM